MYTKIVNFVHLTKNINIFYSVKLSVMVIKGFSGCVLLYLPSYYFQQFSGTSISFLFLNKFFFKSFYKNFLFFYSSKICSFFIKLRIKGLGYRIRSVSEAVHYFFFNYTNFFYFYNPSNLLVKVYKKRMLLISYNWQVLKMILSHIMLLKKMGPYNIQGLRLAKHIMLLKKSGKKV